MTAGRSAGGVTLSRPGPVRLTLDRRQRQDVRLRAVQACRLLCEQDDLTTTVTSARKDHLDRQRNLDALRREAAALYDQLARPGPVASPRPTVVIVHRKPWLCGQVQLALTERGIDVVGYADDGADGSGLSIALAPTLLLLDAQLPSMTGCEVARRVTRCCPDTIVTAQVRDPGDRPGLLEAGAAQVWGHGVLPVVLAAGIADLLAPRP